MVFALVGTVATAYMDFALNEAEHELAELCRDFAQREIAVDAPYEEVQIHGGVGYLLDSPVARFYCDAKVLEIGEGTNEIQHLVIARALGC